MASSEADESSDVDVETVGGPDDPDTGMGDLHRLRLELNAESEVTGADRVQSESLDVDVTGLEDFSKVPKFVNGGVRISFLRFIYSSNSQLIHYRCPIYLPLQSWTKCELESFLPSFLPAFSFVRYFILTSGLL